MRSYVERARAANPQVKDERKLIEMACYAYNNNINRSTGQKPSLASLRAQEVRDYQTVQRAKNYDKNFKKYEAADKYELGDLVLRRIKTPFGKESSLSNVSKNVYKIVHVKNDFPLPSYKLEDVESGIVLPGTYQANVLIKK